VKKLGKRLPVRLIHYDDRSDLGTGVRLYEKLATQDKVDLLLPPWGTAMNFAIAPIAERYKYPMIGVTVDSEKLRTMHRRYFLILIQQADIMSQALVDFLASIKQPANLESVAILYVGDLFGIEFSGASAPLLPVKGFEIVALKSYPLGVKDLSATLKQLKAQNVDVYIGHSYPPDGFLATAQAQEAGFSPKVFYTGVAAIFPSYRDKFGIRVKTMHAWCFGLGLAMAGITGSLLSMVFELTPYMGLPYTVTALIIIILGGLGNILGSLVGAVCLGLLEAMGEHLLGPDMKTIIIYVAFMTILLLRPRGLLGTKG